MGRNWGEESWENIVNQVVIDGRPGDLRTAALGWEAVLRNLNTVKTSLDQNVTELGTVWKGDAYEAFKKHIEGISKKIQHVADEANGGGQGGVVTSLNKAADDLHAAQEKIPVPIAMQPEVMQARDAHLAIPIGSFENAIKIDIAGAAGVYRDIGNFFTAGYAQKAWTAVQDALTNGSDEAREHWETLNGQVADTAAATPTGTPVAGSSSRNPLTEIPLDGAGPGGGVGGVSGGGGMGGGAPKMGAGAPSGIGGFDPTGGSPIDTNTGFTPYTPPINDGTGGFDPEVGTGYTPGTGSDFNPSKPVGTGLAGAGGGLGAGGLGPSGLGSGGLGTGGLGAGGGLGSAGGLGAGGAGGIPGGGALGKPVNGAALAGMGMAGMGGMGAGAGAGAKGAGKGGAGKGGKPMLSGGVAPGTGGAGKGGAGRAGMAGMAGMGGGPGAGFGNDEERSTWLQEDEDVWGGGDAAPGVLR
ncbi:MULTISPECIES: WXG100 family type VII secretion target [Catenuloplanes]|uniref:Uncharacterized protein n=1 Tax=Catenuloplanes niger TaxID=587534 RepID=A0AAE3ZN93_9ACTN|nr:hypothetical protein [Catenuloplanes niger]MDR7321924.1 hypothetical protein [Catenuloplanes niger]